MTWTTIGVLCVVGGAADSAIAAGGDFWTDVKEQINSPLFWFGMFAQALFFARFVLQWIVSERRQRSTVPTAFWYFSLAGGASLFVYAVLQHDPVIMLGQSLACLIYTRNLMLIYRRAALRCRAGLPEGELGSLTDDDDLTD